LKFLTSEQQNNSPTKVNSLNTQFFIVQTGWYTTVSDQWPAWRLAGTELYWLATDTVSVYQ